LKRDAEGRTDLCLREKRHIVKKLVAILIGLKTLPRTPRATHAFDFPGALLTASCLGLFILGIGSAAHHTRPGLVSIELVSALLLGWVLIRRQADHPAPVLPIDLFRRPLFALSAATAICSFAVQGLAFVSLDGADRGTSVRSLHSADPRRPRSRIARSRDGPFVRFAPTATFVDRMLWNMPVNS
jgi:hypothetical protein